MGAVRWRGQVAFVKVCPVVLLVQAGDEMDKVQQNLGHHTREKDLGTYNAALRGSITDGRRKTTTLTCQHLTPVLVPPSYCPLVEAPSLLWAACRGAVVTSACSAGPREPPQSASAGAAPQGARQSAARSKCT